MTKSVSPILPANAPPDVAGDDLRGRTIRAILQRAAAMPDEELASVAWGFLNPAGQPEFPEPWCDIGSHVEERLYAATAGQRAEAGKVIAAILGLELGEYKLVSEAAGHWERTEFQRDFEAFLDVASPQQKARVGMAIAVICCQTEPSKI